MMTSCMVTITMIINHCYQDPSRCQTYDVVIFEEHDDIPKMEQVMWPRHCVQVLSLFVINWSCHRVWHSAFLLSPSAHVFKSPKQKKCQNQPFSLFDILQIAIVKSTNITFQESWGAELHKDLKVWLKKTVKQLKYTKTKTTSWYLMKVFRCIRKPRWCTREAIPTSTPTLHSLTIRNSQKLASKNLSGKELWWKKLWLWSVQNEDFSTSAYFDQKYSK